MNGREDAASWPTACVIGWPVAHSRSPLIHNHWLRTLGLSGRYDRAAVAPADLPAFIAAMPERGIRGGNVTIPHKEAAAALCHQLSATAARLGAVNTIWWADGILHGDSTDGAGFLGALDQEAPGWQAEGGRALVLGAGGAARAIVGALRECGIADVVIANRTFSRAETVADALGGRAVPLADVPDLLADTILLVNTTAAGMAGQGDVPLDLDDLARLPPSATVNDIVYVPLETELLRCARARDLRGVGGLGMLLHQAVPGFARWFGAVPVVTPELRALLEADVAVTSASTPA